MVLNVHERWMPVPVDRIGPLLDRIGGPDDELWPTPAWKPLVLDRPVAPGAVGGHGDIRYRVIENRPGRSVTFAFEPGQGLHGTHTLSVRPAGPAGAVLRHEATGRLTGAMRLLWPLGVRWAHDALLEDLLDRAETVLGTGPARPARWSPWVRLLRRLEVPRASEVDVPDTPLLATALARVDWADAHAVDVLAGTPTDPRVWADALFGRPPGWVIGVLALRAAGLRLAGIGVTPTGRSAFATRARAADEVLLGADEQHLDFRASVLREPHRVVVSTVVALHNRRGRLYFALVRPLHPLVVRGMLNRAARRLSRPGAVAGRHPVAA